MKLIKTEFKDLLIYKKDTFKDNRGYFRELFLNTDIKRKFPFDVMSYSKKNVLRGLHLQKKKSQAKFVSVLRGKILDIVVDLRINSTTFGKHFKIVLSEKNSKSIFIPKGFAHGFLGLDVENIVLYSNDSYRSKKDEIGIMWNDKKLKIKWPKKKLIISQKDKRNLSFDQYLSKIK